MTFKNFSENVTVLTLLVYKGGITLDLSVFKLVFDILSLLNNFCEIVHFQKGVGLVPLIPNPHLACTGINQQNYHNALYTSTNINYMYA